MNVAMPSFRKCRLIQYNKWKHLPGIIVYLQGNE